MWGSSFADLARKAQEEAAKAATSLSVRRMQLLLSLQESTAEDDAHGTIPYYNKKKDRVSVADGSFAGSIRTSWR
jgi:hypothetical protein